MKAFYVIPFIVICGFLYSCNDMDTKSRGPIIMGDSNTIITEADSQYLHDFVADITPLEPQPVADTAHADTAQKDSTQALAAQAPAAPAVAAADGKGLKVAFSEVALFFPGIEARPAANSRNLQHATGATYQLLNGELNGNTVKITSGNITDVSMRYMTGVHAKNQLGILKLDLGTLTSWHSLKGSNGVYEISGLDDRHLVTDKAGPSQIRSSVIRATREARLSRKMQREWQNSLRNVRSVRQHPLSVYLRSVMWKIEGKDANGKPFMKQVRIDL